MLKEPESLVLPLGDLAADTRPASIEQPERRPELPERPRFDLKLATRHQLSLFDDDRGDGEEDMGRQSTSRADEPKSHPAAT